MTLLLTGHLYTHKFVTISSANKEFYYEHQLVHKFVVGSPTLPTGQSSAK